MASFHKPQVGYFYRAEAYPFCHRKKPCSCQTKKDYAKVYYASIHVILVVLIIGVKNTNMTCDSGIAGTENVMKCFSLSLSKSSS